MRKQVVSRVHRGPVERVLWILAAIVLLISTGTAHAQDITGGIGGTVRDTAGAVVAGATVTAVSTERGLRRVVTSNGKGEFELPQLPVGTFSLTITAPTFEIYQELNIEVDASVVTNVDATMVPGKASATVTVTSQDTGIDAQSPTIGTLIDHTSVQELPIDGNNIVNLALLLPGVNAVNAPASFTNDRQGPTYSASGARSAQNLYLFDGIIYNNLFRNTGNTYPPREAIDQIQILINNYGAEYGRNAGSIFSAVTKSGTNVFHGQFWEVAENTAFNADNYLSGKLANKLIQNQFGATFGGPIIKDKIFFFATYQGFRLAESSSTSTKVFSTAEFSNATTNSTFPGATTAATEIYDPNTNLQFPGNVIPYTRFDPTAVNMINAFGLATPSGTVISIATTPQDYNLGMIRGDYIRGRNTFDARYYQIDPTQITTSGNIYSYDGQSVSAPSLLAEVTGTTVITSNLLNVARIGYRRSSSLTTPDDTRTLSTFGGNLPIFGAPTLPVLALTSQFTLSNSSNALTNIVNENVELNDSATWSRGNHNFKFGGNYLRLQYAEITSANTQGDFTFSGTATAHVTTSGGVTTTSGGSSLADFLLGQVSTLTVASPVLTQGGIQHEFFFYAEDQWRARANLTIDYGIRYELPFNWYNPKNYWGTFKQGVQSKVIPNAPAGLLFPGDPGVSRGIVPTDSNNIAPRVGFSWDPFKKGTFVVRGGYGIFFDAINSDIIQDQNQPYQYDFTYSNVSSFTNPLKGQPTVPTTVNLTNPQFVGLPSISFPDPNLRSPYVSQANIGFQAQLPSRVFTELDYVGRFSRKLFIPYTYNPSLYAPGAINSGPNSNVDQRRIIQGFGVLNDLATIGTANYNALQFRLTRRQRNLTVNVTYAYSRSIDTGSVYNTESGYLPHPYDISLDYGPSDFNSTQSGTIAWVMNLPTFQGRKLLIREVLGGWLYSGIYNVYSGLPLNIVLGADDAYSTTPNQRPNVIGNQNLPLGRGRRAEIAQYFNAAAFVAPTIGTYGNTKRNSVIGPAQIINDMAVSKSFHVPVKREGVLLQYRCEALGTFNTPNLKPPTGNSLEVGSSLGVITNTTGERKLQMSLRLIY